MLLISCTGFISLILLHSTHSEKTKSEDACATSKLTQQYTRVPEKTFGWGADKTLDMYYFSGFEYNVAYLFMDVYLQINLTNEHTYQIYQGENCSQVIEQYRDDRRLWGLVQRVKMLRSKQLDPFQNAVIGISTEKPYAVRLSVWRINYIRLAIFIGSVVLYVFSRSLVRNAVFYYTSGCAIGVMASLLIIGFIVYRLTPKSWVGLPILFSGWSISFYIVYMIWKNFAALVLQYQKIVAAYFATVIFISFAISYRYGPPTDVRSHNLVQWALQLIAVLLIYWSCQTSDTSISVIVILFTWSLLRKWISKVGLKLAKVFKTVWRFFFPQCRRLLTMEEYHKEGEEETRKALELIRQYCRNPEVNAWTIIASMRDPKRLISFVNGTSDHVTEQESRLYEMEFADVEEIDESSDDDEAEEPSLRDSELFRRRHYLRPRNPHQRINRNISLRSRTADAEIIRQLYLDTGNEAENFPGDNFSSEPTYDSWRFSSRPLEPPYRSPHYGNDLDENARETFSFDFSSVD